MAGLLFATIGSSVMQTKPHLLNTGVKQELDIPCFCLITCVFFCNFNGKFKEINVLITYMYPNPIINQLGG